MTLVIMASMLIVSIVLMSTFSAPREVTERMPRLIAFLRGALLWHLLVMAAFVARA